MKYSLLNDKKIAAHTELLLKTESIDAATAELGVYKGGFSRYIAEHNGNKTHYAIDTYCGIPDATPEEDKHKNGDFADIDKGEVAITLQAKNIKIIEGVFPDSATEEMYEAYYKYTHFDGDTANSLRAFLNFFYPRTKRGGIMAFDDYGNPKTPIIKYIINDFCAIKRKKVINPVEGMAYFEV